MSIIVLFVSLIVFVAFLTYVVTSKHKESEIAALVKDNDALIKLNADINLVNTELNIDKTQLQDDLSNARNEIWDYETSEKTPVQKTRIDDMKSYIFHLLHKQNAVLGLNENDKEWIRKLGGQLPRGE